MKLQITSALVDKLLITTDEDINVLELKMKIADLLNIYDDVENIKIFFNGKQLKNFQKLNQILNINNNPILSMIYSDSLDFTSSLVNMFFDNYNISNDLRIKQYIFTCQNDYQDDYQNDYQDDYQDNYQDDYQDDYQNDKENECFCRFEQYSFLNEIQNVSCSIFSKIKLFFQITNKEQEQFSNISQRQDFIILLILTQQISQLKKFF
ncbi:hypothetical protein TRFO_23948 [Tritrichomonas foetus]|uniref:Ubiquitin-like domain-containing protein n=1 Tax=Tritrichomonas foetus TaxID=1144522 RepID=A0A1J4KDQ1_9EUKA|nr:hypothetical protein TRFO_23946 [Tritrichomonas foetus]OHT07758.1 hypothetical protein TRFO_23948 [Tritrichomonas foetus]|eukprot:OHT07757.1 hypothetical protein TRFO_23946 [Tritrichomonas foetus]